MAAPWEVVLHHDYRGVPGVVLDRSPSRSAHGRLRGLTAADFATDGVAPGSGALHFRGGDSGVRVQLKRPWKVLRGMGITFSCTDDVLLGPGTLLDSNSFTVEARPPKLRLKLKTSLRNVDLDMDVTRPGGSRWVTVSAGYGTGVGLYYSGAMGEGQAHDQRWHGYLEPITRLMIGNRLNGGDGVTGLIDDVQINRANPRQMDIDFGSRPPDPVVTSCWDDWVRNLIRLLKADRECAVSVLTALQSLQDKVASAALTPASSAELLAASQAYGQHWRAGTLDQIPSVIRELVNRLKASGIDIVGDAELRKLYEDPCFQRFVAEIPPLDCDPAFTSMMSAIADGL